MKKFKKFRKRDIEESPEQGYRKERGSKRKKLNHELKKFKKHVNRLFADLEFTEGY